MEDLMDLIGQLQERYQIDQQDIDVLVGAIQETFIGGEEVGEDVGAAIADQGIPEDYEEED